MDCIMFERFGRAAGDDLEYVQKFVTQFPGEINTPWADQMPTYRKMLEDMRNYYATYTILGHQVRPFELSDANRTGNRMMAGSIHPGFGIIYTLAEFAISMYRSNSDLDYVKKHDGWTMLEFTAETGAVEVAAFLIAVGAIITERFKTTAIANGHGGDFLTVCNRIQDLQAASQKKINYIDELKSKDQKIAELEKKVAELEATIQKLTNDNNNLNQKYKTALQTALKYAAVFNHQPKPANQTPHANAPQAKVN